MHTCMDVRCKINGEYAHVLFVPAHTEDVLEQTDGYDPTIVEEESELTSGGGEICVSE